MPIPHTTKKGITMITTPATRSVRVTDADWVEIHMALQMRVDDLKAYIKVSPTPEWWAESLAKAERALKNWEGTNPSD
jgi:hypothetical protein